jgi:hypothetical protein
VHHFSIGPQDTLPGGFAAGDVRSGSVKRVASAVGDGTPRNPRIPDELTARNARRGVASVSDQSHDLGVLIAARAPRRGNQRARR